MSPGNAEIMQAPCNLLFGVAWVGLIPMRTFSQCCYEVTICKAALVDPPQVTMAEEQRDPPEDLT